MDIDLIGSAEVAFVSADVRTKLKVSNLVLILGVALAFFSLLFGTLNVEDREFVVKAFFLVPERPTGCSAKERCYCYP